MGQEMASNHQQQFGNHYPMCKVSFGCRVYMISKIGYSLVCWLKRNQLWREEKKNIIFLSSFLFVSFYFQFVAGNINLSPIDTQKKITETLTSITDTTSVGQISSPNNSFPIQIAGTPTIIITDTPNVVLTPTNDQRSNQTFVMPDIGKLLIANSDKILIAIVTALCTLMAVYFQKIIHSLNNLFSWIWKRFKVERAIETLYRKNLAKELRSIQILQMSETKNLETIYIPLKLGEWLPPTMKDSSEQRNQKFVSIAEALKQSQRITILGGPGTGKTTITSHVAASLADRSLKISNKNYFPIFIHLRRLKEFLESTNYEDKSLQDLLIEVLDHYNFPNSRKFLERQIANGTCLIILDGFDELADGVGTLQLRLSRKVSDFTTMLPEDNRIILTSRSAGYEPGWFQGFQVFEMSELSKSQALNFIEGWFTKDQEKSISLKKIINKNERLQLLVTTPLMLAIVCFVYQTRKIDDPFLPTRRVDLYEQCVRALVVDWDKSRGVDRKPTFTAKQMDLVLSHVAYDALVEEKIDFSRKAILSLIRIHLPKIDRMRNEDEKFLDEIMEHTGLFKEKAHDTIGFIHLTFFEYLAAQMIVSKIIFGIEKKDLRSEIGDVVKNLANPRWFEPICLTAGILRGRSELITVLFDEYTTHPSIELQLLLAGCLRDADLDRTDLEPGLLLIQDKILGAIVDLAISSEQVVV